MSTILEQIKLALMKGQASAVKELTENALEQGFKPEEIIDLALVPGMQDIGERFRADEIHIPDVLMASRAMHAGMYVLKPLMSVACQSHVGRVVIGTVAGDLHDIGKKLVVMMMQVKGLEVIDVGIDIPPEEFVRYVSAYQPDILGMSALLTTTMPAMQQTVMALAKAGIREEVKIMVGGGPVTQEFADHIGADAYAYDAMSAADTAIRLLGKKALPVISHSLVL